MPDPEEDHRRRYHTAGPNTCGMLGLKFLHVFSCWSLAGGSRKLARQEHRWSRVPSTPFGPVHSKSWGGMGGPTKDAAKDCCTALHRQEVQKPPGTNSQLSPISLKPRSCFKCAQTALKISSSSCS